MKFFCLTMAVLGLVHNALADEAPAPVQDQATAEAVGVGRPLGPVGAVGAGTTATAAANPPNVPSLLSGIFGSKSTSTSTSTTVATSSTTPVSTPLLTSSVAASPTMASASQATIATTSSQVVVASVATSAVSSATPVVATTTTSLAPSPLATVTGASIGFGITSSTQPVVETTSSTTTSAISVSTASPNVVPTMSTSAVAAVTSSKEVATSSSTSLAAIPALQPLPTTAALRESTSMGDRLTVTGIVFASLIVATGVALILIIFYRRITRKRRVKAMRAARSRPARQMRQMSDAGTQYNGPEDFDEESNIITREKGQAEESSPKQPNRLSIARASVAGFARARLSSARFSFGFRGGNPNSTNPLAQNPVRTEYDGAGSPLNRSGPAGAPTNGSTRPAERTANDTTTVPAAAVIRSLSPPFEPAYRSSSRTSSSETLNNPEAGPRTPRDSHEQQQREELEQEYRRQSLVSNTQGQDQVGNRRRSSAALPPDINYQRQSQGSRTSRDSVDSIRVGMSVPLRRASRDEPEVGSEFL